MIIKRFCRQIVNTQKKKMKNVKAGAVLAVVAFVLLLGYMFATPYITVNQMKAAVKNHDADALSVHVDFPALRQNLKDQLNANILDNISSENADEENQFAAFGAALGGMMAERMIDTIVTPAGMTRMMENQQFGVEGTGDTSADRIEKEPFADAVMSYESFNKFVVTLPESESGKEVKYIFSRRGMGWKLSDIMLPL